MSIQVMAAVWQCGPQEQTEAFVLLAIADNADDYGVAVVGRETIAAKARCSVKTVERAIAELETGGWMSILRKGFNGKANVYVVNTAKIGVVLSREARKSPLHAMVSRAHSDKLSRIFLSQNSGDTSAISGDNPQPVHATSAPAQATSEATHATKTGGSRDKACPPNRCNHESEPEGSEPSGTVESVEPAPLPPTGGARKFEKYLITTSPEDEAAEVRRRWAMLLVALKGELASAPSLPQFTPLRPGVDDFDAGFRGLTLAGFLQIGDRCLFELDAEDHATASAAVEKYHDRLARLAGRYLGVRTGEVVQFRVRGPDAISAAAD